MTAELAREIVDDRVVQRTFRDPSCRRRDELIDGIDVGVAGCELGSAPRQARYPAASAWTADG